MIIFVQEEKIRGARFVADARGEEDGAGRMALDQNVVPTLTRESLRTFYSENPFTPGLNDDLESIRGRLRSAALEGCTPEAGEQFGKLEEELSLGELPLKMDSNLMINREQIEELELLLSAKRLADENGTDGAAAGEVRPAEDAIDGEELAAARRALQETREFIVDFQKWQTERVTQMVDDYLPKDFRGDIVRQQKERKDATRQKEIEELVERGGSIKEKYELLARHQLDKRKTLASLGESTGIFRYVIVYVGGVSDVMLDFVKKINDDDGPMIEQRLAYGPTLQRFSRFINFLRIFARFWLAHISDIGALAAGGEEEKVAVAFCRGVQLYTSEMRRFVAFARDLFERSPFFVAKDKAGVMAAPATAQENGGHVAAEGGDLMEFKIAAGGMHVLPVDVDGAGFTVAWDFEVTGGDLKFSVQLETADGKSIQMIPEKKLEKHSSHFTSPVEGRCDLLFDNSHTMWYSKTLKIKAAAMPPVAGIED